MLKLRKQIDFNLLGDDNDVNQMDLDEDLLSEETSPSPPAIKFAKIPVSRVFNQRRSFDATNQNSPLSPESPCPTPSGGSFFTTPSPTQPSARLSSSLFSKPAKKSLSKISPAPVSRKSEGLNLSRKLIKSVNTNPFTPLADSHTSRKRQFFRYSSTPALKNIKRLNTSFCNDFEDDEVEPSPVKRIRVSDFSVTNSRYQEEFLEISEIASGEFGCVKRARHRLDGVDYAVKISKKNLDASRYDEKMALNEVFAHAALIKHKHFVRYYNSWVENGQVYIQNEFCRGGSLSKKIQEMRKSGLKFTETELRKIVVQILKGLQYIHNKQLVHLDIKPDNILIAIDDDTREVKSSSDVSSCDYKIGDLGHVAHIYSDNISPEEGDCRYMAPEFLQMDVDPKQLYKADIFSLGLTLFEAASLTSLPKNSYDDPGYENYRRGRLPQLSDYSSKFNNLLSRMVTPDLSTRPDTSQLLAENHPKCNLLVEWDHGAENVVESSVDTSEDSSLEEFSPEPCSSNSLDLIKAQEKIFDLEKELRSKEVQMSSLNDSFRVIDGISNLSSDEKLEKYENLMKKLRSDLQSFR